MQLPDNSGNRFIIGTTKNSDQKFVIKDKVIADNFSKLKILPYQEDPQKQCLTSKVVPKSDILELRLTDCDAHFATICRKAPIAETPCTKNTTFVKKNTLDLILDPKLRSERTVAITKKKDEFKDMMSRLDQTDSFKAIFSNLWYATLPCYDIRGVTAEKNGEREVLKYCEWKGKPISCAAIFNTFPTDRGMCCSFNINEADTIFQA